MRMRSVLAGLAVALPMGGCVTTEVATFRPQASQQAIIRDGRSALASIRKGSVVLVSPATRAFPSGSRPVFIVGITNLTSHPVDFLVSNVSVYQTQNGQPAYQLAVKSYDELVAEERGRQVGRVLLAGVAAGLNSYAAYQAGYGTVRTHVGGRTYTTTYHSPVVAAIARGNAAAENDAMFAQVVETGRANLAVLEQSIIKDNTMMPGEWYGGQLLFDAPQSDGSNQAKTYSITVRVGSDVHEIEVQQTPRA